MVLPQPYRALTLYRLIVLTRGTGQGTSRSASMQHRGLPPEHQGGSGQQTVVVSGATALQAPRAGSSTSQQCISASSDQARRVPGRLHFWRFCLSPPDVCPTSCRLTLPKGAPPGYQDVVDSDALRNLLEHQGQRYSFSRYLPFFRENISEFSPFFMEKKSGMKYNIFIQFLGENLS